MKRIEFKTFQEASAFANLLAITIVSATKIQRDGDIWWVEDPRDGFDNKDFNSDGIHRWTGTKFSPIGYDKYGFNKDGDNKDGWRKPRASDLGVYPTNDSDWDDEELVVVDKYCRQCNCMLFAADKGNYCQQCREKGYEC